MMGVPAALACLLVSTIMLSEATTTGAETVTVTTTPIFSQIPRYQTSKDFQVLVRVEAPPAAGEKGRRVPIDLAVVLNVGGGAERLDSVKKAVKFIIRQLHDDDRVAVVGPSGSWLFTETATGFLDIRGGRRVAERTVDTLVARDGYAQHTSGSGLEEAIKMLASGESRMSRASFIILVSDTKERSRFGMLLKSHPVVVHTIGMGAAHDPKALLSIAKESHGTYSFVDDQNMDGITGAVAVCLGGLKAVAAVGTRVRLEAAAVEAGGRNRIERIESGGYETTISSDKASGDVAVGVLYAGESKSFIVHLHVPPATTSSASVNGGCDKQELLTASFVGHYYGTSTSDGDAAPTVIQAILSVQRPPPEGGIAAAATLRKVPIPVVMNHIAQFGVLDMVTSFVEKEIWELSSITTEVATAMATKLQGQWEQFLQERQFWSGLDLGVLEIEINKMVSSLTAGGTSSGSGGGRGSSPLSYMLSWLSSYQMQRPTAMGSPSSVAAAFVTLSMQVTLQQATTTVITGLEGGCPACECDDGGCVEPAPPPVFVPSGRGDGTYRVNAAYPAALLLDAINQAMNQMYLALVQASNLRQCNSTKVEVVQPPRAVA